MAVDTRDKRFSMIGIGSALFKAMPNPDGGFASAADRQMLAYTYSGIAADAPSDEASEGIPFSPTFSPVQSITGLLIR